MVLFRAAQYEVENKQTGGYIFEAKMGKLFISQGI